MASSLRATWDEYRSVKVLVVPVGGENSLFEEQRSLVSTFDRVHIHELKDLNSTPVGSKKSPFRSFSWGGNLLFDYVQEGEEKGLDALCACQRILIIFGVINYAELEKGPGGQLRIQQELLELSRKHPHVVHRKLFLFNFDPQHAFVPQGPADDPSCLVFMPPTPPPGSGPAYKAALQRVHVHVQEILSSAALSVLAALEKKMAACDDARAKGVSPAALDPRLSLTTFLDDLDDKELDAMTQQQQRGRSSSSLALLGGSPLTNASPTKAAEREKEREKGFKKKPLGRTRKWQGDLCLQACCPLDALECFSSAISECRALADSTWLAGALEGYTAAIMQLILLNLPLVESLGKDLKNFVPRVADSSGLSPTPGLTNYWDPMATRVSDETNHGGPPVVSGSFGGGGANAAALGKALALAEDRALEALGIYTRYPPCALLEAALAMRLARLHARHVQLLTAIDGSSSSSGGGATNDPPPPTSPPSAAVPTPTRPTAVPWAPHYEHLHLHTRAWTYTSHALRTPGLDWEQQIACATEGSFVCKQLGLRRKQALLLYVAAVLAAENDSLAAAEGLLVICADLYGLRALRTSTIETSPSSPCGQGGLGRERQAQGQSPGCVTALGADSWPAMRADLLLHLGALAREQGRTPDSARCLAALTCLLRDLALRA